MSGLPRGWCEVPIADVTEPFVSVDPRKFPDRAFRYVDIGSIDNTTQTISETKHIKGSAAPSRARRIIQTGDTLFSTVRTYLKNVALVPEDLDGELTSTGIAVLRPNPAVAPRYLFNWARSEEFISEVSVAQDGTMYPAVTDADVAKAAIRVPPLPEQRRIVAKTDSLSGKSRRARDHLDHIPRLVEKYKQAILAAAYSGSLPELNKPQRSQPISAFIATLDQGWSPKCESEPASAPDDWAVIKTTAIQPIQFMDGENKRLPPHLSPRHEITVEPGDVLITRAGPRSRVAIACVVKQTRPRLMLCDKAYRLRAKPGVADPTFLALMLNAPQSLEILERMKTGISDSGLNLTQSKFLDLPIPEFSLGEQEEIAHRIETAFAWIDRLSLEATSARKLIDHLDQAILTKAFRGELVPQDPNDEPASVLLEKIKTERSATIARPRKAERQI